MRMGELKAGERLEIGVEGARIEFGDDSVIEVIFLCQVYNIFVPVPTTKPTLTTRRSRNLFSHQFLMAFP
jgi:hypothetical protein